MLAGPAGGGAERQAPHGPGIVQLHLEGGDPSAGDGHHVHRLAESLAERGRVPSGQLGDGHIRRRAYRAVDLVHRAPETPGQGDGGPGCRPRHPHGKVGAASEPGRTTSGGPSPAARADKPSFSRSLRTGPRSPVVAVAILTERRRSRKGSESPASPGAVNLSVAPAGPTSGVGWRSAGWLRRRRRCRGARRGGGRPSGPASALAGISPGFALPTSMITL